ncbi:MAG: hypothetical protein P4L62_04395 [Candidatus Pacebacteria bacterium]|nr:hypothetical protein [Candidatus Paceibacterota bacterium]
MIINKGALEKLVILNTSCRVFGEKKADNTRYLIDVVKRMENSQETLDYAELVRNLPQKSFTYKALEVFARMRGWEKIHSGIIHSFFSEQEHVDFTLDQIAAQELRKRNPKFADKFLFSHLLVPVTLYRDGEEFRASYVNGKVHVAINGLLPHPWLKGDIPKKGVALIHFATIVEIGISNQTRRLFKDRQAKSKEFMEAAGAIKEIDYRSFWNVHEWTKDFWKCLF